LSEFAKPDGTQVYKATSTDPDGDTITYSLSGTDSDKFDIDANGKVTLVSNLDANKTSYAFTVTATDGTLSDTVDVTGTVTDKVDVPFSIYGANVVNGNITFDVKASTSALDSSYSDFDTISLAEVAQFAVSVYKIGSTSEVGGNTLYRSAGDGLELKTTATDLDAGFDRVLDVKLSGEYIDAATAYDNASKDPNHDTLAALETPPGPTVADLQAALQTQENLLRFSLADSAPTATDTNNVSPRLDVTGETETIFSVVYTPQTGDTFDAGTYAIALSTKFSLSDSSGVADISRDIVGEDIWVTVDIA